MCLTIREIEALLADMRFEMVVSRYEPGMLRKHIYSLFNTSLTSNHHCKMAHYHNLSLPDYLLDINEQEEYSCPYAIGL